MNTLKQSTPKKRWISKEGMEVVNELLTSQFETGFKQCAIMKTTDVAEQARRLPKSFVGECPYFYMSEAKNQKDITGDYLIVFAKTGVRLRTVSEHFTPSMARKITIRTDIRKMGQGSYAASVLRKGCWGAVDFKFDQYYACIGLEAPPHKKDFDVAARVVFQDMEKKDGGNEDYADRAKGTKLERILALGINDAVDNCASFGIKELGRDPLNDRMTAVGFRFMELEVDCLNPDTGKKDHLGIVAVKLNDEVRDVGSPFILAQRVHYPDPELYDWPEF